MKTTGIKTQLAGLARKEKNLCAILKELHEKSALALDKDFVRKNYVKYEANLNETRAEIARLKEVEKEINRRYF